MTEREKMFAGKIYDPFSEGMPEQRTNAHRLCALYNVTTEIDEAKRKEILDELLPNRGEGYICRVLSILILVSTLRWERAATQTSTLPF